MIKLIKKIYNIWILFGELLGNITSKIVLFILFFLLFTPISIFFKIVGKNLLDKEFKKGKKSYWTKREIKLTSMKYQF